MKITDDILKALQNCIDGIGSISEFSQRANVSIETVTRFLGRKTNIMKADTWEQIYPLLRPYLPDSGDSMPGSFKPRPVKTSFHPHRLEELSSDEKILLDAFGELPRELQNEKLIEIVELARGEIKNRKHGH